MKYGPEKLFMYCASISGFSSGVWTGVQSKPSVEYAQ